MPDDFHSFQAECAVAHQRTPAARRSTATVGGGATGGRRPTGPKGTSVAFGAGADVCTGGGTATRGGIGGGGGGGVGGGFGVGDDRWPVARAGCGVRGRSRGLLLQRVALAEERDEIRVRGDLVLDPLRALALDGRGAGEPQAQIAGLGLALDERAESRIVRVSDTEHAVQHIDRALYSRRDLRLLRPGRRLSRGRLPPHLDQPLRLLEALELVEPPVDVIDRLDPAGDVARRLRDEDLTRARRRTDAGGQ